MTELSPAAETVLNAVTLKRYDVPYYACPASINQIKSDVAAALRAVANQANPKLHIEDINYQHQLYVDGWKDSLDLILTIAAELRGTTTETRND